MPINTLPVVGVMGSSETAHDDLAEPLGRLLAGLPAHLLTGGGAATMASVCKAFVECEPRRGLSIGVIPAAALETPTISRTGYPNRWVELPIHTHLIAKHPDAWGGLTRNHVNILSSDVVVALPGSRGTAHEIELALNYGKPVAAFFHRPGEMDGLPPAVAQFTAIEEVRAFLAEHLDLGAPPLAPDAALNGAGARPAPPRPPAEDGARG